MKGSPAAMSLGHGNASQSERCHSHFGDWRGTPFSLIDRADNARCTDPRAGRPHLRRDMRRTGKDGRRAARAIVTPPLSPPTPHLSRDPLQLAAATSPPYAVLVSLQPATRMLSAVNTTAAVMARL